MNLCFTNRPVAVSRELYSEANGFLIDYFSNIPNIVSIYQFGNITSPGISDIDMLIVVKEGEKCLLNGFENLPDQYKYLFTHGMMALNEKHFHQNHHFTLWSDYIFLSGNDIAKDFKEEKTLVEIEALKIQTALEFLVANYIDLKVQLTYGIIKLRSFLQHMKGILYDLEFLGVNNGELYDHLKELKKWITNWFDLNPSDEQIIEWIHHFDKLYTDFVDKIFSDCQLYLPNQEKYSISRNALLINADKVSYKHSGVVLPNQLSIVGKKYSNLQNRFNDFEFHFPLVHDHDVQIVKDRFTFLQEMKSYNREFLPNFMTITTSITSKLI